jgi:hypothetical protein
MKYGNRARDGSSDCPLKPNPLETDTPLLTINSTVDQTLVETIGEPTVGASTIPWQKRPKKHWNSWSRYGNLP